MPSPPTDQNIKAFQAKLEAWGPSEVKIAVVFLTSDYFI